MLCTTSLCTCHVTFYGTQYYIKSTELNRSKLNCMQDSSIAPSECGCPCCQGSVVCVGRGWTKAPSSAGVRVQGPSGLRLRRRRAWDLGNFKVMSYKQAFLRMQLYLCVHTCVYTCACPCACGTSLLLHHSTPWTHVYRFSPAVFASSRESVSLSMHVSCFHLSFCF